MKIFSQLLSTALAAVFTQNIVFERALGANLLVYAARKKDSIKWLSLLIVTITGISSVFTFAADKFLRPLFPDAKVYGIIIPLLYIIIVSAVYICILTASFRFLPALFAKIRPYVHLSVFNCAVLGSLFINNKAGGSLGEYAVYGLCTGLGFLLAGFLIRTAAPVMNSSLIPSSFRGMPVTLVYIGIISLALHAFAGYSAAI
jgi:electron transport complex protein RnfA